MCRDVRAAVSGKRNETLNACAYRAGRAVGAGILDRKRAEQELLEAARVCGLGELAEVAVRELDPGGAAGPEQEVLAEKRRSEKGMGRLSL